MNHRTEAEAFRARVAALSRPQLEEAMRYLRERDPDAMERALHFAAGDITTPGRAHCLPQSETDPRVVEFMRARINHLALNGTAPMDPLSVDCPDCGAAQGDRCWTAFGCMARFSAAQVTA